MAAARGLRLLTESQFNNSALDIFQVGGTPTNGLGQKLDDTSLEQRATIAANVASQAVASLWKWAPCTACWCTNTKPAMKMVEYSYDKTTCGFCAGECKLETAK